MLELAYTAQFKKDYKKVRRHGRDMARLDAALRALCRVEELPAEMRDHELVGGYKGHRECHLAPDWLLIYRVDGGRLTLTATRLGSHSGLF